MEEEEWKNGRLGSDMMHSGSRSLCEVLILRSSVQFEIGLFRLDRCARK